jgi:hypothetical protein
MRTEREVRMIVAAYEEQKILQRLQIDAQDVQISWLKEELRRAQLAAQEVVNSTFAAMRVPPPHNQTKPERGPMRPIAQHRTWEDARKDLERIDATPPKEEAEA